jgi:hypothetical protein
VGGCVGRIGRSNGRRSLDNADRFGEGKHRTNLQLLHGGGMLADGTIGVFDTGRVDFKLIEFSAEGNKRTASIKRDNTKGWGAIGVFAELPNRHLLVPQTFANKVLELDKNRKVVKTFARLIEPNGVQLLPDGNILITTRQSGIVTFDSSGRKLKTETFDKPVFAARKYPSDTAD